MRMTAKIKSGTTIINIVRAAISIGASSSSISTLDQTNNLEKQKQQNRYYNGLTNRSSERLWEMVFAKSPNLHQAREYKEHS
jgi:hypothetical protein